MLSHCKYWSEGSFFGSTKNKWQLVIFDDIINLICDFRDGPFGCYDLVFSLQIDVAVVCNIDMVYRDSVFWISEWAYFREESSETTWGVVFSALVDGSFAWVVERCSDDDNISIGTVFDEGAESRIIVDHLCMCKLMYHIYDDNYIIQFTRLIYELISKTNT